MVDRVFGVSALSASHSLLGTQHISHISRKLPLCPCPWRAMTMSKTMSFARFNSLVTGTSSSGQLCSHGFWDDDSLSLENDAIMERCVIPVFFDVEWYVFSLFWPTNQNGGFESLYDRVLCCSLLKLWKSLAADHDCVERDHCFQFQSKNLKFFFAWTSGF